ncbi:MAG: HEAT repeat domain-containing protein [Gemmatimonadetes bacterium]|nr:HEAT repeat domain-containing protein [Gemmatimonadota bacterium]MCY3676424.1 HEAT repeat domain-containing protein [Gemmatimonadota bacterium]MYA43879.1 HEAT repeat domain-containing protein [Gemmatimonadota bacterium]MYE91844.1 HEAT repeat domain-containing protein [Gemmatimonadota bacterium]MYJ10008.1 HEAT repeat domain-containing protein [Gemmatimonadota bacterium]
MNFLKALFGPSQKTIWRQLSREVRGQFHEGGLLTTTAVQARAGDWIITLDTVTTGDGKTNQTFTRLRAPYFNPERFRFEIYRASIFSGLGKALGMQDVGVGHPRFDQDFVIKSNTPGRVRRLFDNRRIRKLIDAQPRIHLSVKAHEGWFSKFPEGVDELHFQAAGVIKDLPQLKTLFDLFAEVLREVCHEGKAYEDDVRIHIRRLRAPGGRIEDKHVLWESYEMRRDAAAALGRLGDPAAIPALAAVLRDEDQALTVRAIEALAEIGHRDAVGPLVPLLGSAAWTDGRPARERAAEALRKLGQDELVETLRSAFAGDFSSLKARGDEYRAEIIAALAAALATAVGARAANALAEINAVEALPQLRQAQRSMAASDPAGEAVSRAIRKLKARAALPRAASAADVEVDTLPRAAREPGPATGTLPRGAPKPAEGMS